MDWSFYRHKEKTSIYFSLPLCRTLILLLIMTTARDIQKWNLIVEKAQHLDLSIELKDSFCIYRRKHSLGRVETLDELYTFMCGYEWSSCRWEK